MATFTFFSGTAGDDLLDFDGFKGVGTPNRLTIGGGDGDDRIVLNTHAGVVHGDGGNDTIIGNNGNDALRGNEGNDVIKGHSGHDRIYGGSGADELRGGSGNDTVIGDEGSDALIGGNGNDVLFGDRSGPLHKDGSAYADVFRFDTADGNDKVRDFGIGVDTVYLHGLTGDSYTLDYNGTNTKLFFGATEIKFVGVELTAADIVFVDDGMTF